MTTAEVIEPEEPFEPPVAVLPAPGLRSGIRPNKVSWGKTAAPTLAFLARRILSSVLVLLGATFIVYVLLRLALNPFADLEGSTDPNLPFLWEQRFQTLGINNREEWNSFPHAVMGYFGWLWQLVSGGGLGTGWSRFIGQSVSGLLAARIPVTLRLVLIANLVQILLGVLVGIVAALRQYTRFDYGVTFMSFVLFSLPSFWVAVLLKTWGAIGFNDFLADPRFSWPVMVIVPLAFGGILSAVIGGSRRNRWISFVIAALATLAAMFAIANTNWIHNPALGIPGIVIIGLGIVFALVGATIGFFKPSEVLSDVADVDEVAVDPSTGIVAEAVEATPKRFGLWAWLKANRAVAAGLSTVLLGALLYTPMQFAFHVIQGWWPIIGLGVLTIIVGLLIGWLWGGFDRRVSMRVAALTAFGMGLAMVWDRIIRLWSFYAALPQVGGRPVPTIGSERPGVRSSPLVMGDFWVMNLDSFLSVLLPTIALVLIGFAGYTRYTRASMLEVMNQDYIRTARAKGLPERVVTVRHAFRNALIPLATIIPLDLAGLFGGAIITERIFGWHGMGSLFFDAVSAVEIEVVMGHFLVTGTLLVIGSIIVDLIYAVLDPRIRVNA